MPYYCTVPQCTSMSGKIKNVSFHQFPRDEELAKLWNKILKRGKPYTKYSKVCSLHFKPEDFKGVWKTLKKDAIPSQNLPVDTPPRQKLNLVSNVETQMQQQWAHAIYSQTMLTMQAACLMLSATKCDESSSSTEEAKTLSSFTKDTEHSLSKPMHMNEEDIEEVEKTHTNQHNNGDGIKQSNRTYTCNKCLKHYKDYDVFLLHTRTHKNDKENENIGSNQDILRANPILANLLTSPQENNVLKIENEIENSLIANIADNRKNYLHNLATLIIQDVECNDEKKDEEED